MRRQPDHENVIASRNSLQHTSGIQPRNHNGKAAIEGRLRAVMA
jgi:hypothetical protein